MLTIEVGTNLPIPHVHTYYTAGTTNLRAQRAEAEADATGTGHFRMSPRSTLLHLHGKEARCAEHAHEFYPAVNNSETTPTTHTAKEV